MSVVQMKPVTLAWAMRELVRLVLASRPADAPMPLVQEQPGTGDAAVTLDAGWPLDWMQEPAEDIRKKYLLPLAEKIEIGTRAWDHVAPLPNPIGAFASEVVTMRQQDGRGFSLRGMARLVPHNDGGSVVQIRVDVIGQGQIERVHVRRKLLLAYLEEMPEEAFGWFVAWGMNGWPDGLGGFKPESRAAIEALQVECRRYADLAERDRV